MGQRREEEWVGMFVLLVYFYTIWRVVPLKLCLALARSFRSGGLEVISESDRCHPERCCVVASQRGSDHQQSWCKRLCPLVSIYICLLWCDYCPKYLHYAFIISPFSCLQPAQSTIHRTTRDVLQVGQLAPWEWQKVRLPPGNWISTWFSSAHCDIIKMILSFLQLFPSPLLRGAFVGGHTDAYPGDRTVAWFAPGPGRCHGARRSPGEEGCWSSVWWYVKIHLSCNCSWSQLCKYPVWEHWNI